MHCTQVAELRQEIARQAAVSAQLREQVQDVADWRAVDTRIREGHRNHSDHSNHNRNHNRNHNHNHNHEHSKDRSSSARRTRPTCSGCCGWLRLSLGTSGRAQIARASR